MAIDNLNLMITIFGLLLFAYAIIYISIGRKRVATDKDGIQKISFWKFNFTVTIWGWVILAPLLLALAPLGLTYFDPSVADGVDSKTLEAEYIKLSDLTIGIVGPVTLENESLAEDVRIKIIRERGDELTILTEEAGQYGYLNYDIKGVQAEDQYTIYWLQDGYPETKLSFSLDRIPFPHRLTRGGSN